MSLCYLMVTLGLFLHAIPLARLRAPINIQTNEPLVIIAQAFMPSPLIMSYPFSGTGTPCVEAPFEAVSGVTTTELSTLTSLEKMPRRSLFAAVSTGGVSLSLVGLNVGAAPYSVSGVGSLGAALLPFYYRP